MIRSPLESQTEALGSRSADCVLLHNVASGVPLCFHRYRLKHSNCRYSAKCLSLSALSFIAVGGVPINQTQEADSHTTGWCSLDLLAFVTLVTICRII